MEETRNALWEMYKEIDGELKQLKPGDDQYKLLLDARAEVMNDIVKLDSIESENKREKGRNITTFVLGVGSFIGGLIVAFKSFRFDSTSTMTSTVGRSSVTNVVSKIFKL